VVSVRYAFVVCAVITMALCLFGEQRVAFAEEHVRQGSKWPSAPEFSLRDLNGRKLDLSAFRGKVVLLDFWATWCDPCREEIPRFVSLQNRYRDQGLQVLGISMDDEPQPVRHFLRRFHLNYPVAMGDAKLGELYGGVLGLPIVFLINRAGGIGAKYVGATKTSVLEREIQALLQTR
jgi:peroxiredoxin